MARDQIRSSYKIERRAVIPTDVVRRQAVGMGLFTYFKAAFYVAMVSWGGFYAYCTIFG